jgi:amino acid adenylation domain-containing protein
VEAAGGALTHRQLRRRASGWAARLAAAGAGPGTLVGVCLPREPDLVAAMLGILSTGAAYVPVDPAHPVERTAGLLRDAGVVAVATDAAGAGRLAGTGIAVVTGGAGGRAGTVHHPHPEELAYVVHTSGSTGRPKGVAVPHGAFADRVSSMRRMTRLTRDDVLVAVVPVVTDVWQQAVFTALTGAGRLVLAAADLARDPVSLAALLHRCGATFLQASPTTWLMLVESGWSPPPGFRLLSGGEAMDAGLVDRLRASGAEVWDMYGPTEATVFSFGTRLTGSGAPAWVPAANTTTYLLDETLEPVLPGTAGHLFVGGAGLARGYLGRPGPTADAFRPDPFAGIPGARMYATGDLGRRDRHGGIEILGRRDHQLKIRGFRVEPGEVEAALTAHPAVSAAVVCAVTARDGEQRLAAYVAGGAGASAGGPDADDLRRFLTGRLPGHLVPTHLSVLAELPRLPNGKVDRAALPAPDPERPAAGTPYTAPVGPVEEAVATVWADLLGVARVGRDDDFFALGGHSLLTVQVIARLRRDHGIDVSFRDLLERRTVRGVAAGSRGAAGSGGRPSALVRLGGTGAGKPLFCVHPGGGSAHWYRHLADEYAGQRPLSAFEWPGLHGGGATPASVAEVARLYGTELRAARPTGPYHILGWCGSSGIAWELARHLWATGERPRLILIDPFEYPSAGVNPILANLDILRRAETLADALRAGSASGDRAGLRAELTAVLRRVVDDGDLGPEPGADLDLDGAWLDRLRSWRTMLELRATYRFTAYPGRVDLVLCADLADGRYDHILGQPVEDYLGHWRRLAAGGIAVHHVPGNHRTALFPPHVSTLAATVAGIIDEE